MHVFFFCSGFGLYLSYLRHPLKYKDFIRRRVVKIYIPYAIIIAISFSIPFVFEGQHSIDYLCSHLFLYKMFIPKYDESLGIQMWFISTIIQLYLVFIPLCLLKNKMRDFRFITSALIVSFLWWIFIAIGINNVRVYSSFFLNYLWEFCLGMVMGDMYNEGKQKKIATKIVLFTALIGIMVEGMMALTNPFIKCFNDIPAFLGFISLITLLYRLNFLKHLTLKISKYSYELFLVHMLIFELTFKCLAFNDFMQFFVGIVAFVISLLVAKLFHLSLQPLRKALA